MMLHLHLQDRKGKPLNTTVELQFAVSCLSDAAQQLPHMVIMHNDKIYGYRDQVGCTDEFIFREKVLLCV